MSTKILKYLLIGTGSLAVVVVVIGVGMYHNIIRIPIQTGFPHAIYSANYSKPENLMGGYHNVFVGRVNKKVGERMSSHTPKTQFSVDVVYNIKGNLGGSVVIDQMGGVLPWHTHAW